MYQDADLFLEDAQRPNAPSHAAVDNTHGGIETRTSEVCTDIALLREQHAWPVAGGKMVRTHETREKVTAEIHTRHATFG